MRTMVAAMPMKLAVNMVLAIMTKSPVLSTRQTMNIPIKVGLTMKAIPLHFARSAEILPSHALLMAATHSRMFPGEFLQECRPRM